ncbi:MAG: tol-pal system-associated acyl-CoA thioesterase [Rhodospirillales bacterium]
MQDALEPASGRFDGREHRYALRVFYEDTDAAGIVYYANYLKFAERARTEAMRLSGRGHQDFARDEGLVFVVRHVEVDYLVPAVLDDIVLVRTRFTHMGAAYIDAEQRLFRDETLLARVVMRVVSMTKAGRPARIPPDWRMHFQAYLIDRAGEGATA